MSVYTSTAAAGTLHPAHPREFVTQAAPSTDTLGWVLFPRSVETSELSRPFTGGVRQGTPWNAAGHRAPFDWNRAISIVLTALVTIALLGFGLLMVVSAGVPVAECAPWIAALVAGGMSMTLLIHLFVADRRQ